MPHHLPPPPVQDDASNSVNSSSSNPVSGTGLSWGLFCCLVFCFCSHLHNAQVQQANLQHVFYLILSCTTVMAGYILVSCAAAVPGATGDMPPKGWGAPSPPAVSQTPPATDSEPAQPPLPSAAAAAATGTKWRSQGPSRQGPTKSSSPSLWSWFEASPHSSQEEF
jgi:hypothetical protein